MLINSSVDHRSDGFYSQPRGFLTPPPTWKTRPCSPVMPASEQRPRKSPSSNADIFRVVHKVPSGDSPYCRAKHVQLIDKDPNRAVSLFWAAINSGDRVDSALKDMAVVMKQLNRSDEAIEAIKSFRNLCPPDSQEALDNILVELFKQSGRIEEEIEVLQRKLKRVESGLAFGGSRTKLARSQGKKIHITVEKEYSRLSGNLAWAYMQKKDFPSAEEHYRKSLTFELDKNKQCNLAICLLHMNRLSEAKFLLEAVRASSGNDSQEESHAKSYERACEMLAELESRGGVLTPAKRIEQNTKSGIDRGFADRSLNKMKPFEGQWEANNRLILVKCSSGNIDMRSSPLISTVNRMNDGAFTEFPFEKRADLDWRGTKHCQQKRVYESSSWNCIPKDPFTQPQRWPNPVFSGKGALKENAYGASCRKLSFESSACRENAVMPQVVEKHFTFAGGDCRKESSVSFARNGGTVKSLDMDKETMNCLGYVASEGSEFPSDSSVSADCKITEDLSDGAVCIKPGQVRQACKSSASELRKKNWADMVEEEEQESESGSRGSLYEESSFCSQGLNDENLNSNIIPDTPKPADQADEKLSQKIEMLELENGYFTQPEKASLLSASVPARRSLYFDQSYKLAATRKYYTPPLKTKSSKFEGQDDSTKCLKRRNRLQIFKDITSVGQNEQIEDRWRWKDNDEGKYMIRGAHSAKAESAHNTQDEAMQKH